jgi:site-specific DNA-methyltransferase (adenine-specific)
MVLCDLPYGTTACKWDTVIDLEALWTHYRRVCKPGAAMVFTATQPFTTILISSNLKAFKYSWVWDKQIPGGMAYARFQPMRQHEDVLVFCTQRTPYYPQLVKRDVPIKAGGMTKGTINNPGLGKALKKMYTHKNPTTLLSFPKVRRNAVHPTQKPVELFEYLVRTYTTEGALVLDNCCGSGTTGVACQRTGRNFIQFDASLEYCQLAVERLV